MSFLRDSHSSDDNWVLFNNRIIFVRCFKTEVSEFCSGPIIFRTWRWLRLTPTSQLWPQSQSCSSSLQPQTFKVRLQRNQAKPEKGKYLKSQRRDLSIKIKARSIQQPGDLFAWHTQGHFVPTMWLNNSFHKEWIQKRVREREIFQNANWKRNKENFAMAPFLKFKFKRNLIATVIETIISLLLNASSIKAWLSISLLLTTA